MFKELELLGIAWRKDMVILFGSRGLCGSDVRFT